MGSGLRKIKGVRMKECKSECVKKGGGEIRGER